VTEFDAIVVGSGMSGGWCAKELAERGLKVLVLERGRDIDPVKDYTDTIPPWELPTLDRIPQDEIAAHYPIQHRGVGYAVRESTKHFWVKDDEHPYVTPEGRDYDWLRGYHLGGRSIMWWRQSYRLGPQDFTANKEDGHGVDWPIRYEDIAPWYDYVERFAGISGDRDNVPQLPDGEFQPAFELTCVEQQAKEKIEARFPGRRVIASRVAHLTEPTEEQQALGRSRCQVRSQCDRGCIFGAYFSSLSATLPAAKRTGNCTIVTDAIVHRVEYDEERVRVTGVQVIDANSGARRRYSARVVFLNASAIASAMILLQSTSARFPGGLANGSGQVGRNLMDHVSAGTLVGMIPGFENQTVFGRRPGGIYIPRYANITEGDKPYLRGFGMQGSSSPAARNRESLPGIGVAYKEAHRRPGPWLLNLSPFGEVLPNPDNRVTLHPTRRDRWGLPLAMIDAAMGDNEQRMMDAAMADAEEMLRAAGAVELRRIGDGRMTLQGNRIHEMGSARMGRDPATSVLNGWCQAHEVSNLFITDGAFMTSAGCQNPSLGYMAFSARAANYAADLLRDGQL
jgi:choline dehydrogenase-like flavoprotein